MPTIMSSREFNQDTGRAKRAALDGPVLITDRGSPTHVLLSLADYQRLSGSAPGIVAQLAMAEDVPFEPLRLHPGLTPASFE